MSSTVVLRGTNLLQADHQPDENVNCTLVSTNLCPEVVSNCLLHPAWHRHGVCHC